MSYALCKPYPGLLVEDMLMLGLPHMRGEDREHVAWEYTGWPSFFAPRGDGEWHPSQVFYRQLREFRAECFAHAERAP